MWLKSLHILSLLLSGTPRTWQISVFCYTKPGSERWPLLTVRSTLTIRPRLPYRTLWELWRTWRWVMVLFEVHLGARWVVTISPKICSYWCWFLDCYQRLAAWHGHGARPKGVGRGVVTITIRTPSRRARNWTWYDRQEWWGRSAKQWVGRFLYMRREIPSLV